MGFLYPSRSINKVITFSEFEIFFSQLDKHSPVSGTDIVFKSTFE